ncbi:outer membrane lipoprotein carrier protein LolA [Neoaquamicrobium sediminum]|uniref:Outer membrane lipoprotein carrier protein LolA n=1 Tax=Neoaquamicrobium sediminum TaxID=1849104 RepID=A0ABV3WN91_9HYPH|nr:outer membrane lipoprotein carrier protein LolA [Mesorhizobium sediminum]NRC53915.1 outer membrane lipoprotein carrier protein LolA [Mesorhizobium sediminum]
MDTMAKTIAAQPVSGMTRRSFLGAAALGIGVLALAQVTGPFVSTADAQAATAQRIADHFASVRTMMGEFVQFGPRGEQTGGKFYIERPGKVRFNYEAPSNFRVTSDGTTVVLENTKLRTADIYPLSRTPLKLLLDDRIDLSGNKVRAVKEEDDLTTIQLADKSVFGDSTITMMFDPASFELRQWTITDAQGKDTTVMIFNVEQGVVFDPSVFAIDHRKVQEMQQRSHNR